MARRFDAAETLVEQPKALPAAGTRVRSAVQVSPGHPGTPAGSAPPHHLGLGEHLTSATGRAPSRTATQRAAVAVAVCNAGPKTGPLMGARQRPAALCAVGLG